jgi:HEAT repeat protein
MRAALTSFVLVALLVPADAAPAVPLAQAAQSQSAAVARLLGQAAREGRGGEQLVAALVALGDAALPDAFAALTTGRVLEDELDGTWIALGRAQTQATLTALTRFSPAAVRAFLGGLALPKTGARERTAALQILAEVAKPRDLDLCLTLATDAAEERGVRLQLAQTLLSLVAREPEVLPALAARFAAQPPALYAGILRAVGSGGSPQALRLLSEQLGRAPAADALLLCEIARLGGLLPQPIEARVCTRVREFLRRHEADLLGAAVYAVGRLGDWEAAEPLVALLESDLEHVRTSAHRVLRELSGEYLPLEHERWTGWLRRESEWWRRDAPFHEAELGSGAQFQVAAALRELARHRLYRHEIAPEVARCLTHPEPDIGLLACAALGQLGSRTVLPELVDLLERGGPDRAAAAQRALERITGQRLGADPKAWLRLLQQP